MKKRARIIQINGFKGLIITLFIVTCLAAGFIAFPGFVAMNIWNSVSNLPMINLYQGVLLWMIVVISVYIMSKRRIVISFGAPPELNEEELKTVMERIKKHNEIVNELKQNNIEDSQNDKNNILK